MSVARYFAKSNGLGYMTLRIHPSWELSYAALRCVTSSSSVSISSTSPDLT